MVDLKLPLRKRDGKDTADTNLSAPAPALQLFQITRNDDEVGVELVLPIVPVSYFDGDEVRGYIGAGATPDAMDRMLRVQGDGGMFTMKKNASHTVVTCVHHAFSEFVKELETKDRVFYIFYALAVEQWNISQPLAAIMI